MRRRLLNQAAHAAVKMKGGIFELMFRRLLSRMNYSAAIWAIAHRLCRLVGLILRKGVRYQERGVEVSARQIQAYPRGPHDSGTQKTRLSHSERASGSGC